MTNMSEHPESTKQKPPPVDRLSDLWRRINDHKMVQWTVAYVAVAYAIQHGVTLTREALEWPQIVERGSLLLLALGLPVVMTFAWYHGERASRHFSKAELTIISLLLVVGSLVFYVFVQPSAETAAGLPPSPAGASARSASLNPSSAISLAVLPFVNLSSDKEQEFFSDGMTEEITSALAKVPKLRVVGRTSAFQYKNENKDLRAIGQALSAAYLIEGSVRKAGDQVRITAQLIKADDGTNVWTESYDRQLTNIFATQEDIARAIAASLQIPLGLKQGESLVSNRTGDLDAYQEYLRARTLIRARDIPGAIAVLERSVPRNPNYAPGWALLAIAYEFFPIYELDLGSMPSAQARTTVDTAIAKADMAAHKAIELDPTHPSGYAALGWLEMERKNWTASEDAFKQALLRDPDDPDTLHLASLTLMTMGRLKQALETRQKLRTLDPFVPVYNVYAGLALQLNGRVEEGLQMLTTVPPEGAVGVQRNVYLSLAYAVTGRRNVAADTLLATTGNQHMVSRANVEKAAKLLREGPAKAGAEETAPDPNYYFSFVQALNGSPDVVLRGVDLWTNQIGFANVLPVYYIWHPTFAPVRKTERFKEIVRKAGLVDYWKARGWPDLCHPFGADDFACE
jgi:TolB-like protein